MLKLTTLQKQNLKYHQYKCVGISLLDPYLGRFWNKCAELIPNWIAPNMITLVGLITNVLPIIFTLFVINFDTSTLAPTYLLVWLSVSLFVYQTLDAIDGKHARRINMSSPLGEVFDHGCDALSTILVNMMAALAIQPHPFEEILFLWSIVVLTCSFVFHWQTFVTGSMFFTLLSVTEAQLAVIVMCLIPAITTSNVFHLSLFGVPLVYLFFIPVTVNLAYAIMVMFGRICNNGSGKNGSTIANSSVISPGISPLIVLFTTYYIYRYSPANLISNNFYILNIFYGFVFSKLCLKILVCIVTKSIYIPIDISLMFPMALVINIYVGCPLSEVLLLQAMMVIAAVNWISYFFYVCTELSKALNVPVLLCKR
uniref:Cholinephosphotransferase 1 n=1 Tax=Salmo salar TaxID=8030 RepID=B5XGA8_SALSA|nr:cholinephosphotransferase 1 [Salmo salar]ACI69878.1 Cholinephosphotransferase 1 [Salmo salar]